MTDKKITQKAVPINYVYPDDLKSYFVNNMVIQHQPEHFTLSFFEVWPPPILIELEEDSQLAFEDLESIDAKCVARLVVTPSKMREIINIMLTNLEKYEQKFTED